MDAASFTDERGDGRERRVLIADDNADFANTLAELLRLSGYEVVTAPDGHRAVAAAREFLPQVVLLDLAMPSMDGFEAAAAIRAHPLCEDVVVVALTGHGTAAMKQRTRSSGLFDLHLVKPAPFDEMLLVLRACRSLRSRRLGSPRIDRRRHTVLVADDTPAQRYAIARGLSDSGFGVLEARNGAEALALAHRASAVVLDVCMPDLDGRDVARMLRAAAATARTPIVHHSAMTLAEADIRECHDVGGDAFLVSPIPAGVLARVVESVIEQHLA